MSPFAKLAAHASFDLTNGCVLCVPQRMRALTVNGQCRNPRVFGEFGDTFTVTVLGVQLF